jgi:hypothetical protein
LDGFLANLSNFDEVLDFHNWSDFVTVLAHPGTGNRFVRLGTGRSGT